MIKIKIGSGTPPYVHQIVFWLEKTDHFHHGDFRPVNGAAACAIFGIVNRNNQFQMGRISVNISSNVDV